MILISIYLIPDKYNFSSELEVQIHDGIVEYVPDNDLHFFCWCNPLRSRYFKEVDWHNVLGNSVERQLIEADKYLGPSKEVPYLCSLM